ncbi:NFX1-type zinc finger-containing protein 1 [Solea senegalensis]|uniref:NFX1-type zinc finger-containing protein 1 n=1 Tax=Solea senegalensis TaxID=28829 RepID=A0AAV6QP24_SOLSE|nr:NFX1-type zinc finger-containing protein 1 [Solea senegalensis]
MRKATDTRAATAREQEGRRSAGLEMEERREGLYWGDRGRGGRLEFGRGGDRYAGGAIKGGANVGGAGRAERQRGGVGGAERQRGGVGGAERQRGGAGGAERGQSVDGRRALGGHRRTGSRDRQISNGGRSQSTSGVRAPRGSRLGYKTLEELSGEDPSVVAITLSSSPALQDHLCATEMRQDLVELLCLVMSKAFKSQAERGTLQHLASLIKDSLFFRTTLPHYLAGMVSEFNPLRREKYPQHLENILTLLHQVLSTFPASSVQAVSLLLTLLQASMNNLSASGVDIQPQIEETVKDLQSLVLHLQEKSRDGTLRSDRDTYSLLSNGQDNADEEGTQQDFRTIPIYPHPEEFRQDFRPFLRPNFVSRPFKQTHIYLDTHFRLLREDFVQPLRDAVQQLVWLKTDQGYTDEALKAKRHDDILVYFNAQLLGRKCTHTGLAYTVQFDIKPLKFVRWENSKRLIYGSLICLSCDNFQSLLFATVSDRDPKQLQKGRVLVTFTERSRFQLAGLEDNQVFLMVESTAYFEAYRYVLEGLQEQREDELPFQRNIVECRTDVRPPAYLQRRDMYDLSSIAEPKYQKSMPPFHSLKAEHWPEMEKLGLDESQMKALKLALTQELAIIQGPPGTGKTHVGLKIAQALLTNQDLWRDENGNSTVLVVCYTNHALDQFLEGIHKFLKKGIVRVGGRSNSEILKHFNLREISRSDIFKRSLPPHLRIAFKEIFKQLHEEERKIESDCAKLECSWKGILHENFLQEFMSNTHWAGLHRPNYIAQQVCESLNQRFSPIMEWLGVGSIVFLQRETENANENEDEEEMELEKEELIEITEEADLIQAERIIDDDISPRGDRDHGKKGNMKSAVREVEELMLAMNLEKDEIQTEQREDEWEMQREQKKKLMRKIKRELQQSSAMTDEEADKVSDVWALTLPDRWRLYRLWVARYRKDLNTKAVGTEEAYQNAVERLAEVRQHEDLFLLKKATVIGMTTTGAAKYRSVLQQVRPRLVIVEEAAQVFEAHTITTLSQACQHLILIGDHQQLHPSATVYELARNFNLEISMFERMVNMGIPYVRLNYQHRMRPDIARLLTPHIYKTLENHSSVLDYEDIKGLNTNLFFVEHNHLEEMKDGKSHQNLHEAMFVVALCRYLLLQEYKPEQITILTTYTSQFHCLRKLMPASQFLGVRVHVVDKYQGEENDIILLSLVRSNHHGKVGFLSIPNRVCVALSRAKKGLYCIGNSATLSRVKLWTNIFHTLREKKQIGEALTLCCQNHPDRQIKATCGEDFKQAPEGGCTQPCQFRLDCGHVCASVCHPYDPEHKKYKCAKQCQKTLCDLSHKCPLVCYRECPKQCPVKVQKIIPQCQHPQIVPCHQDPETFKCKEPCQKMLSCGHPCKSTCGEPCTSTCMAKVSLVLKCGHSQQDACFYKTVIEEPVCRTRCKHQLKCGHFCQGSCVKCYQGRFHIPCYHKCERLLVCSHNSKQPCFQEGSPCQRPCENCCVHSQCKKSCGQSCTPCTEPCSWHCPHHRCRRLCSEPCDRPPCTQPCGKTLKCGHPCIGLCGDKCPSKCRICNHDEVTEILFGTEDDPEAHFIQLEDCGHIFEYTAMDKFMGMDDNKVATEEEVAIKLKECPKCRTPVRKNLRYGAHINHSLAEIELVKMKINGNAKDTEKHREALNQQWEERLATSRSLQQYKDISDMLEKPRLTAKDLWVLEHKMAFLTRVTELIEKTENMSENQSSMFTMDAEQFVIWLYYHNQHFTEQQVYDLERQLQRLTFLAELNIRCHEAEKRGQGRTMQLEVQTMRKVLQQLGQFTEQDERRVKETMKELNKKLPLPGLGICDEERKMIISAMKVRAGHWYKCPNGHVYLITECGGAMESRQCPDCDATIGGASHRLADGNQVASEMDGALHPAWSEANNLLNFEL